MSKPHETDPVGARNLDAEAQARLPYNQGKEKADKPHPSSDSNSEPTPGTEQTMLLAVAQLKLTLAPRLIASTYVPNAHMMFTVLNDMDNLLMTNRYWSSKVTRWSPLHTRIYYGVLFFVQTFRCMITSGIAPPVIRRFMKDFEDDYHLERLPIAGPLVPFFRALAVCEPPFTNYGNISPTVPTRPGCTVANACTLEPHIRVLLPNLTGLRRGVANMRRPLAARAALSWDHNLGNTSGPAVPVSFNASNEQSRDARIMPGTVHQIGWSMRTRVTYQEEPTQLQIPDVPANHASADWPDFLGLSENMQWFGALAQQAQQHASYFKGATNLATVSPFNGACGLIQVIATRPLPERNSHRDAQVELIDHRAYATSLATVVSPPSDMMACFTQINWKPPINFSSIDDTTGDIGVTLHGPWWNVSPEQTTTTEYDPSLLVPQILAQHMHVERPVIT